MQPRPVDWDAISRAAEVLRRGGLVAMPTETVYGLAADAGNPDAVRAVFSAKGRPADHPVIVHVADVGAIGDWAAEVPAAARELAAAFWPGPLTLVLKRDARVPDLITGGQDTVGLRSPAHPWARALLQRFGGAVAAPSANRFGRISPTTAQHVIDELGLKPAGAVDMVLDGGPCPVGIESTIVDLSGAAAAAAATGRHYSRTVAGRARLTGGRTAWRGSARARTPRKALCAAHSAGRRSARGDRATRGIAAPLDRRGARTGLGRAHRSRTSCCTSRPRTIRPTMRAGSTKSCGVSMRAAPPA